MKWRGQIDRVRARGLKVYPLFLERCETKGARPGLPIPFCRPVLARRRRSLLRKPLDSLDLRRGAQRARPCLGPSSG